MGINNINSKDATNFAVGAGAYYGLSFIFNFYPAWIFGLVITQHSDSKFPEIWGLLTMIGVYLFMMVLVLVRQYIIVCLLYIITFWPFLHQIITYCSKSTDQFPLPSVDWCPFW